MITREPVYCDITELLGNPIRTGIQRVVREVLRNWSGDRPLRLCRFDADRLCLVEIPQETMYYLIEPDIATRRMPVEELKHRLAKLIADAPGEVLPSKAPLLVPELFLDEARCRHYLWLMASAVNQIYVIFFDFIPWLHPEAIGVERGNHLMWYIRLAQATSHAGFISQATMLAWQTRIVRDPNRPGVVLPLGTDGLSLSKQSFVPGRRDFVTLGSIDGRKNQQAVLEAFEILWDEGLDVSLSIVGRVFEGEQSTMQTIASLAKEPRFRHFGNADDNVVTEILEGARATIYASVLEGFGLPPVESLAVGIPCIASEQIPSLEGVKRGLVQLNEISPEEIAAKVRLMINDDFAERVWAEASTLSLPTWRDFGEAIADWVK